MARTGLPREREEFPDERPSWERTVSTAALAPTRDLVLGRYRPVRPLGSGGTGSVWLAHDEETGLDVALKIVPREGKAAARAEREAHAARRLRHERCVRAYDVGHEGGYVYIAYEYVPGRTVREALRRGELSDRDAVEVAAQILEALAHAHRAGIVHRDVKPSNVLLEEGEGISVRLLDFGLAQLDGADTLTAPGDVPGTLAYIAPERLAGADATPESDVWSVGVLLWEALAGRHPFWGLPLQEVASAIEAGAPPLALERPDLPRRLLAAIEAALDPDPRRRPGASVLAADLRSALARDRRGAPRARRSPVSRVGAGPRVRGAVPALLAGVGTLLGATFLPFWPPLLVGILAAVAALAGWRSPRLGLAVALATPVFPLGNLSQGAAVLYVLLATAWLALVWRDPSHGLSFVVGPLLAPLALLALVPLAVQPVRNVLLRALQAALAILTASLVTSLRGEQLLGPAHLASLDIGPRSSAVEVAAALVAAVLAHPVLLLSAALAAFVAALLPLARRASEHGVAALGLVLVAWTVLVGSGPAAALLVAAVWVIIGAVARERFPRRGAVSEEV